MVSSREEKTQKRSSLTYEEVTQWRETLFDGRSLQVPVEELKSWPLDHYLWAAVLQSEHLDQLREPYEEHWQTPAWDFGRFAKAHPALVELNETQALALVKKTIGTQFWGRFFHMDQADAEMAFDHIWVQCRAVPGYDPLTIAVLEAKRKTGPQDGSAPAGYHTFLAIAESLQRQVKNAPFMLPCHKLASILKCKPMTISRYRQKAVRDGHLKIVKEHSFRSNHKGEATEFTFVRTV